MSEQLYFVPTLGVFETADMHFSVSSLGAFVSQGAAMRALFGAMIDRGLVSQRRLKSFACHEGKDDEDETAQEANDEENFDDEDEVDETEGNLTKKEQEDILMAVYVARKAADSSPNLIKEIRDSVLIRERDGDALRCDFRLETYHVALSSTTVLIPSLVFFEANDLSDFGLEVNKLIAKSSGMCADEADAVRGLVKLLIEFKLLDLWSVQNYYEHNLPNATPHVDQNDDPVLSDELQEEVLMHAFQARRDGLLKKTEEATFEKILNEFMYGFMTEQDGYGNMSGFSINRVAVVEQPDVTDPVILM